ncbi:MAG: SUMF1/EgtB/PvdO family nonheme iron enzyme [Candidatus Eremiobacteraeota bacterium]|nr:SUMF1/EgtB/PvdO family nonheme iron enzyme [Candidatus Eremiobacteraeota bacterium]MBC5803926.1 SUMF1/EgtB/PvdO family nonheme iron enzyme [Candidatus Eremiobacteraeota bacterium]MBC5820878.1 SUMF1/EgtB/PvdO family nonheme iron enzyme [Candidatus Eremiobacteraeota bacterium]
MQTTLRPVELDRAQLRRRYLSNRDRTADLFGLVDPSAYYERPIGLRHPIVFYEGHIPAFSFSKLVREALRGAHLDPELERLFARGIDPASVADAARHERASWPERAHVQAFAATCDAAVLGALAAADLTDAAASPLLERGQAAFNILEHEEMHHETLLYMLHRLPLERKALAGRGAAYVERDPVASGRAIVPAGRATLGAKRDVPFAWDNEFDETPVDVAAFEMDVNDVTNGDWLAFVRAGGPVPSFWLERDGAFMLLGMFEEMPLPLTWPVYVTQTQARAYAAWRGGRLPTEAEYHRAAFGTPSGEERVFPWGDAAPTSAYGNFDFRRFDPEPVGTNPAGASAWGIHDLVGNGWEWTSTPFAPLPGFTPMASYPQYSADFFDGAHFVVKGASPVTNRHHVRRSFRNWYRPDYPYVYATFRTVNDS